jgi:hypothetical protein
LNLLASMVIEHRQVETHQVVVSGFTWSMAGLFYGWWMWRLEFEDEDS